jgi:hypothetical protein
MFIPVWLVILILTVFTACSNKSGNVVQNTAPQATSSDPPWYYASVIQVGGEGSTIVSKTVNTNSQVDPTQPVIDQHEYDRYIKISYNTPKDIMWLSCGDGYEIEPQSEFSSTGNDIYRQHLGYGIRLSNIKNHLVVLCRKTRLKE